MRLLEASPRIEENRFTANHSVNHAAGIYCVSAAARIRRCEFTGNSAGSGTGIYLEESVGVLIEDCDFEGNHAVGLGGGVTIGAGSHAILRRCAFRDNDAQDGGAICVAAGTGEIRGCTMSGNRAVFGGGVNLMSSGAVWIEDCLIEENLAEFFGGGFYALCAPSFTVADCTLRANTCWSDGGAGYLQESGGSFLDARIESNVDSGTAGGLCLTGGTTLAISHSLLFGNGRAVWVGSSADPIVDARDNWWGHDSGPYHPTGNPLGQGDAVSDRVEFTPWLQLAGVATGGDSGVPVLSAENPARGQCRIRFDASVAHPITLSIHDAAGRRIRVLPPGFAGVGRGEVIWDGRDADGRARPSGTYWLRLQAGDARAARTIVLIR